jgi:protein involved in polysaccharide export with SLBB domain
MKLFGEQRTACKAILASMLALLMCGCIGLIPSPFRPSPGPREVPRFQDLAEAFDIVCRNYRLGPDDTIRIIYQQDWTAEPGQYKLDTLDKISIKFLVDPNLNEEVVIRPDGMITLQAIGDIKAAGLTPEELAATIEKKFLEADILSLGDAQALPKNYKLVTVHVLEFYQKLAKLVQSLTTLAGGQQTNVLVNPDGEVDLPMLPQRISAVGKTVREVEKEINEAYRSKVLKHVRVSVSLGTANSRKFYVLGQAGSGAYEIRQPITILQALAIAGPTMNTADLTSVILISRDAHGKPFGRRVDVKRMLDIGDMTSNILVKPYDVIYVPKTFIADVNLFMDQYIGVVSQIRSFVWATPGNAR